MVRGDQVDQGGDQVAKTGFSVGEGPRVIRLIRFFLIVHFLKRDRVF